jgi:hypothetical protein
MAPGRRRRDVSRRLTVDRIVGPRLTIAPLQDDSDDDQPQNRRKSAKGKRPQESEDESEEDAQGGRSQARNSNLENRLAHRLVRYAIACEFSRTPVRREAVREKGACIWL